MATEQRKIDWLRIITAYSIPLIVLIGTLFVAYHRLAEAEGKIDTKVDTEVHVEVHKAVTVRLDTFQQEIVKTNKRIEQVNYDAIQRQDVALAEIIKAIKDK